MTDTYNMQLDPGVCGTNLQIGSDPKSAGTSVPRILLHGNGGASEYYAWFDEIQVAGSFKSDGWGNVCIKPDRDLADGNHVLRVQEIAPNKAAVIPTFSFNVDTQRPSTPSTPVLSTYSDSGVVGDHVTIYRNINFTGTSDPGNGIQLFAVGSPVVLGGAKAGTDGKWSATTTSLRDGTYDIYAIALDQAGNKSDKSGTYKVTIGSPPPPPPPPGKPAAPGLTSKKVVKTITWTAPADGGSPITGYNVYRGTVSGGETYLTNLGNVLTFTDNDSFDGALYKVSAVNAQGEGPLSNEI